MALTQVDIDMLSTTGTLPALDGSALTGTGSVLQTVYHSYTDSTSTTLSQSYVNVTNGYKTITSIGNNSEFLVTVTANIYQSAGTGCNLGISRTISGTTTRLLGVDGASGDSWLGFGNGISSSSGTLYREYLDSPSQSAGTAITYQTLFTRWTAGTIYVNYSGYSATSMVIIQEIAA